MPADDPVDPVLRCVERQIDQYYLCNPLLKLPFNEAAWLFLAFCEELFVRETISPGSSPLQGLAMVADSVMNHAKWPLRWIRAGCAGGGKIPKRYDASMYQASWDLSELSRQYDSFESAFSYASAGRIDLRLDGHVIRTSGEFREDTRYDAYDRLVKPEDIPGPDMAGFLQEISQTVRVRGDQFAYHLSPKVIAAGLEVLGPELARRFRLPPTWRFARYMLGDFHRVASVLYVLAFIHFSARVTAAARGCVGLGYARSLHVMSHVELISRLVRYTQLSQRTVESLVDDLSYGSRVHHPDPALQPLIPLGRIGYCWSPSLCMHSAMERNHIVLLNRFPEDRQLYAALSAERERLSRESIQSALEHVELAFWAGSLQGDRIPDIDLAIVSHAHRWCLVLELKSFLEPAEIREVIERSEEIARGVEQVRLLKQEHKRAPHMLSSLLGIGNDYDVEFLVASEWSVGAYYVQAPDVPIVRTQHLVRRLKNDPSGVCQWLRNRAYLPTEGVHYEAVEVEARIADWRLEWYGIRPLVDDEFI